MQKYVNGCYTEMTDEELSAIGAEQVSYSATVESLIRARYSVSDELAILRQRDTKPEEFSAYNAYAEDCKAKARAQTGGDAK